MDYPAFGPLLESVDSRQWTVNSGQWAVGGGQWTVARAGRFRPQAYCPSRSAVHISGTKNR